MTRDTAFLALCAKNYGSFQLKVPQTLIAGTHSLVAFALITGSVYGVQCFLTFRGGLLIPIMTKKEPASYFRMLTLLFVKGVLK